LCPWAFSPRPAGEVSPTNHLGSRIDFRISTRKCLFINSLQVQSQKRWDSSDFRHIVNFRKIPQYNAVNAREGYGSLAVHSPLEVTGDDLEEEGL